MHKDVHVLRPQSTKSSLGLDSFLLEIWYSLFQPSAVLQQRVMSELLKSFDSLNHAGTLFVLAAIQNGLQRTQPKSDDELLVWLRLADLLYTSKIALLVNLHNKVPDFTNCLIEQISALTIEPLINDRAVVRAMRHAISSRLSGQGESFGDARCTQNGDGLLDVVGSSISRRAEHGPCPRK
jgi:hypothetical protein